MGLVTRTRLAGILAIFLLTLGSPWAMAGTAFQPDLEVRLGSGSYVGNNIFNTNGRSQSVSNSGVIGQKMTFFIEIVNNGVEDDTFKIKRSGFFHDGYRVRYFDAANNDVTGQVNAGSFKTPVLDGLEAESYVMRATVKIRPSATACSHVTRLIIATSVNDPSRKDAVGFSASLDPNCQPVANDDANSVTEDSTTNTVFGNVLDNDTDPDGDPLTITSVETTQYGTLSINGTNGNYSYQLDNSNPIFDTLDGGETLPESIEYEVSDGHGGTDTAILLITIHGNTDP